MKSSDWGKILKTKRSGQIEVGIPTVLTDVEEMMYLAITYKLQHLCSGFARWARSLNDSSFIATVSCMTCTLNKRHQILHPSMDRTYVKTHTFITGTYSVLLLADYI